MPVIVGDNSYVGVTDADAYFLDRLNSDKWDTFTEKDQALITATTLLDSLCKWYGDKSDFDQLLEFPRMGDVDTPDNVKKSQLEIAIEMVNSGSSSFVDTQEIMSKMKAGSVTMEWYQSEFVIPVVNTVAKSLLSKYGTCSFGGSGVSVVRVER